MSRPRELGRRIALCRGWASTRQACILLPALVLLLGSVPYIGFLLPNTDDNQVAHSCQPLKTLRFFHSRGQDVHKWGPVPNFLYAPAYGALLLYWHSAGTFTDPSGDYPYGLTQPHEQLGTLIFVGRLIVLVVGVAGLVWLTRELARASRAPWSTALIMTTLASTDPELVVRLGSTSVDGPMMAFLGAALAAYVIVVFGGLNKRRGAMLSVLAVCSLSCKELTAPLFILPYLGLAFRGWLQSRGDPQQRRRFVGDYGVTVLVGVLAYALLNVVYAPASWLERMDIVFFGTLKDPAIWASADQTALSYFDGSLFAVVATLGYGGTALLLLAAVLTVWPRPRHALLAWLPFVSHVVLIYLTAGYMPTYFMLPTTYLAAIPVVVVLSSSMRALRIRDRGPMLRGALVASGLVLLALDAAGGMSTAAAMRYATCSKMVEDYVVAHVDKTTLICQADHTRCNPGSTRLAYLGYNVDDRSVGDLVSHPDALPELVFADQEWLEWTEDVKRLPARAKALAADWSGFFDYSQFNGFESLGYRPLLTLEPRLPRYLVPGLSPRGRETVARRIVVYQLSSAVPTSPRSAD